MRRSHINTMEYAELEELELGDMMRLQGNQGPQGVYGIPLLRAEGYIEVGTPPSTGSAAEQIQTPFDLSGEAAAILWAR